MQSKFVEVKTITKESHTVQMEEIFNSVNTEVPLNGIPQGYKLITLTE